VSGDWDDNGADSVGVYVPAAGRFLLRNTNSAGLADIAFNFQLANRTPITGSWDGL
jgi:hypothetical protein